MLKKLLLLAAFSALPLFASAAEPLISPIGKAWSQTSINTVIFRHGPLATFQNTQYAAYYDRDGNVILAKRTLPSDKWETRTTPFHGNGGDAHNTISIGMDGNGILHIAWDHHNVDLNYAQTTAPGSLDLTDRLPTDGLREHSVTYPEFYSLANGDLLLTYRVGSSGNGDVILKRYSAADKKWSTLQSNLVSGKSTKGYTQNAYTEMNVDAQGTIHLGWVWRRTPDVGTNHDVCYARSTDGGLTWTTSTGKPLTLPITDATCEVAVHIPERSDLINQTTLAADDQGHPYIGTYYKKPGQPVAQIEVVYNDDNGWRTSQVGERTTPLNLGGGGTKAIPLSRPLILVDKGPHPRIHVVFRDVDRGSKVSLATSADLPSDKWTIQDLTPDAYGYWEPTYDATRWRADGILDLFLQNVDQKDGADNALNSSDASTMASVLEYKP
jgi:BNR repeat-containing family member